MAAVLQEKQFELGDVVFGTGCPTEIKSDGFVPGTGSLRTQDTDIDGRDGIRMGQDFRGAGSWAFSLFTNGDTEEGAWAAQEALMEAWDSEDVRTESGAVMPLRYCIGGVTRRVYGRPRRYTPAVGTSSITGRIDIEADFTLAHHLAYSDQEYTATFGLGVPYDPQAGIIPPFIPPITLGGGTVTRTTSITIGGRRPTPITVKFTAPNGASNLAVRIGDWTAALVDPLEVGGTATIDARPWVMAATGSGGGGVRVSPRITRISQMWLAPGTYSVNFTGQDVSGEAEVLVSWREAFLSPR